MIVLLINGGLSRWAHLAQGSGGRGMAAKAGGERTTAVGVVRDSRPAREGGIILIGGGGMGSVYACLPPP